MKTLNLHLFKVAILHLLCPLCLGKGFCVALCESSDPGRKWFADFSQEISCYLSHSLEFGFVGVFCWSFFFFFLKSLWLWQMLLHEMNCTTSSLAEKVSKLCQFSEVENESVNLKIVYRNIQFINLALL